MSSRQSHLLAFVLTCALTLVLGHVTSCSSAKPIARTVNDVARDLCAIFFSEKQGISFEDAAREACSKREVLDPFIREVLKAKQAATNDSAAPECKTETTVTVVQAEAGLTDGDSGQ